MLKVRAITPIHVSRDELRRRQDRYKRLSPANIRVTLDDLGANPGVPRALNTVDDIRRSEELVAAALRDTDPSLFDAVLPDCVLDPALGGRYSFDLPIFGISHLSAHFLAAIGQSFTAVTRNVAIGSEFESKMESYELGSSFRGVEVLGLSVEHISDTSTWAAAITASAPGPDTDVVINGCSAVDVDVNDSGSRVVDPTALALKLLGIVDEIGVLAKSGTGGR